VTIGIFVSGAFVLLAGLILYLGTAQLYERTEKFILFFDESVNGLSVGSPVKFKGVPIGKVTRILIRVKNQPATSSAIPVIIELDQKRLYRDLNMGMKLSDEKAFSRQIANGLRAKLNTESFITGQLFIELDYIEGAPDPVIVQETLEYKEIPTVPSTAKSLTKQAMETIASLSRINFASIMNTLEETITLSKLRLEQMDVKRVVNSVTDAADAVNRLAESIEFSETQQKLNSTLDKTSSAMTSLEQESLRLGEDLSSTLERISAVFSEAEETLEAVNDSIGPDSRMLLELESTLHSLSRAADSLSNLADFIERNPNAVLRGRIHKE